MSLPEQSGFLSRRVATDGVAYTYASFEQWYGPHATHMWDMSAAVEHRRLLESPTRAEAVAAAAAHAAARAAAPAAAAASSSSDQIDVAASSEQGNRRAASMAATARTVATARADTGK